MNNRTLIEHPVSEAYEQFRAAFALSLQSEVKTVRIAVEAIRRNSGKHIRPLLLLLAARACGRVGDNTVPAAVLIELLHTASLLHDDVIDDTKLRRGVRSVNAIFDNRIAVLVGDFILADVMIRAAALDCMPVVHIVATLCREMSQGEIKQIENADRLLLAEKDYFLVLKKKTATLLASCTEIGAVTAGAPLELQQRCHAIGTLLGYAFQIRDDIFDYFDDPQTGKPNGNDLREGKVTLPLLHALSAASPSEKAPYLDMLREKKLDPAQIATLIDFARERGGIAYAEMRMNTCKEQAATLIRTLPSSDARTGLLHLADYLVERTK
ncbi:MAG: polyprenyl synthetase family protein [Tannerella sp.]|jgi:octaprenyl-diphosphate synthase|nr:polyprenyl synthetase family protein [Tannerella sp.]